MRGMVIFEDFRKVSKSVGWRFLNRLMEMFCWSPRLEREILWWWELYLWGLSEMSLKVSRRDREVFRSLESKLIF